MTGLAAIVTVGEVGHIRRIAARCADAARTGASVTVFFRDETIPLICNAEVAVGLTGASGLEEGRAVAAILADLKATGDVHLHACSSSLYLWGVSGSDLIPPLSGARGLIAFLAEDLAAADEVISG
jgi:peroxiredoxin family protein